MSSEGELLRQLIDNMTTVMARVRHLEAREVLGTALCGVPIDCSKGAVDRDMWVYDAASSTWLHLLNINPDNVTIENFLILPTDAATIDAAGAITATASHMVIDTFGGAATDNLDTINGGVNGAILIVRSTDSARDPTLRDGVGNLVMEGAVDFTLTNSRDTITFIYLAVGWLELSRSNNR